MIAATMKKRIQIFRKRFLMSIRIKSILRIIIRLGSIRLIRIIDFRENEFYIIFEGL